MICLGYTDQQKNAAIMSYCNTYDIQKVFLLTPEKFRLASQFPQTEVIEWAQIIEYKYFYRLLQEIDAHTLLVINECMRTQNRYDLTYNCIRHFLNQTTHQLIFQYLPLIDTLDDYMILFDFDTRSRWKREKFRRDLFSHSHIALHPLSLQWKPIAVPMTAATHERYRKEKDRLFAQIGLKDPHTIPRNLYLVGGKDKLCHMRTQPIQWYLGRNNRFALPTMQTYKDGTYPYRRYTVFEFCHHFIDMSDFLSLSRQTMVPVLVANLKVDTWYMQRYTSWKERLDDAYAVLQQYGNGA
jgi:hypothetical protein